MSTISVRFAAGYAAILGTVPYLMLKALWLSGSTIGITDKVTAADGGLFVLNLITAGMDLVAIVVALALTHRWGQRIPAWLVLFPIWIGAGFLAPIAVATPIVALAGGLSSSDSTSVDFLEPWVQPMVYAGFAWQGVMLMIAFALYARVRWPGALRPPLVLAFLGSAALFSWGAWGLVNLLGNTVLVAGHVTPLAVGRNAAMVFAGAGIAVVTLRRYARRRSARSRTTPTRPTQCSRRRALINTARVNRSASSDAGVR